MNVRPSPLLSIAFRPFFLLGAIFAVISILLWVALLHGAGWAPVVTDPVAWHAHEMLFGFGGAAIAGFLLTAVATWTGRPPIAGGALGALAAAWLAGRAAMLAGNELSPWMVAAADLAFPAGLAVVATREIVAGGSRRNYGIAGVTLLFASLDGVFHLGRSGLWPGAERPALYLAAHGILLLITVVGGRIIPSFTSNWLRGRGDALLPRASAPVEALLLPAVILAGIADSLPAPPTVAGALALLAAVLHAWRLSGWRSVATPAEPLVAVLHVAYAWLPIGYLLLGLSALGLPLPRSAALHALTMGGIGTMILAVTTRVALGHTGRALVASRLTVAAYVVLNVAVLVRISGGLAPAAYLRLIDLAAAGWVAAFGLFLLGYWAILTQPRKAQGPASSRQ
jgi:uncharacterized protein involved in response to NO